MLVGCAENSSIVNRKSYRWQQQLLQSGGQQPRRALTDGLHSSGPHYLYKPKPEVKACVNCKKACGLICPLVIIEERRALGVKISRIVCGNDYMNKMSWATFARGENVRCDYGLRIKLNVAIGVARIIHLYVGRHQARMGIKRWKDQMGNRASNLSIQELPPMANILIKG